MNGLPYYPRYPRDFLEGTVGMPFELKGAYALVLDLIYMMGERGLPDDPHFISGHLGCSVRKWNTLRKQLLDRGKIAAENGIISNKRADKEKIIQRKYQDKQAENRRGANKNKDLEKPAFDHTDTDTDTKKKERTDVRSQKAGRKSRLPDDWRLPADWGEWALGKGLDELSVRREAEQFANHHHSKGSLMLDWRRAWQTWVNNSINWKNERQSEREARKGPEPGDRRTLPDGRTQYYANHYDGWMNEVC